MRLFGIEVLIPLVKENGLILIIMLTDQFSFNFTTISDFMIRWNSDDTIGCIGDEFTQGTYLLLIHVKKSHSISFGRFDKGRIIDIELGYYIYIGSALNKKGATSLGNRLSRHCLKSNEKSEHRIRQDLLKFFDELEIHYTKKPSDKTLFWNIDHLNNLDDAEIIGIIFIRSPHPFEISWSEYLDNMEETYIFAKGLGANDSIGHTHVQKLDLGSDKKSVLSWLNSVIAGLPQNI